MSWTLITGAAKGLGQACALSMASAGYPVVIHYHTSKKEAEETSHLCHKKGVAAEIIQGDFSTQHSTTDFIDRYISRFSDTTFLVNNVGNYLTTPLQQQQWRYGADYFKKTFCFFSNHTNIVTFDKKRSRSYH